MDDFYKKFGPCTGELVLSPNICFSQVVPIEPATQVPVPSTLPLMLIGIAAAVLVRKRVKKSN